MTERERWGLRGTVQSCRIQRTCYVRKCGTDACEMEEWSDSTTLEFRADGSLIRRSHHNPDGSEWTTTCEYDDAGRLLTERNENGAGLVHQQVREYDTAGRLARVLARPPSGGDRIAESYEYDAASGRKKLFYVDQAAQRPDTHYAWGVEGTDSSYSAPRAARLTTLYDARDQPLELLFHDKAGRQLSRVEFLYDEAGHLVAEEQAHTDEGLPPEMLASLNPAQLDSVRALFGGLNRRTHRYDGAGRRVETRSCTGPLGSDVKAVTYNELGDPIQEVCEHEERDCAMDEEGRLSDTPSRETKSRSEARFRYDYDAHGNWVLKTVESRGAVGQDFTVSSVEHRTITYF